MISTKVSFCLFLLNEHQQLYSDMRTWRIRVLRLQWTSWSGVDEAGQRQSRSSRAAGQQEIQRGTSIPYCIFSM